MDVGVVFTSTMSCAGKRRRNWKRPKTVAYLAFAFPTITNFFINTRFAQRGHYGRFSLPAGEASAQNSDSPTFESFYGAVRAGSRNIWRHWNVTCKSVGGGVPESVIVWSAKYSNDFVQKGGLCKSFLYGLPSITSAVFEEMIMWKKKKKNQNRLWDESGFDKALARNILVHVPLTRCVLTGFPFQKNWSGEQKDQLPVK